MNAVEYADTQDRLLVACAMMAGLPLKQFLQAINGAEAAGPILDPTLYRAGGDRLLAIRSVAQAGEGIVRVLNTDPALRKMAWTALKKYAEGGKREGGEPGEEPSTPEEWAATFLRLDGAGLHQCILLLGHAPDMWAYQVVLDLPAERRAQVQQGLRSTLASIIREVQAAAKLQGETAAFSNLDDGELSALIEACNVARSGSRPRPPWDTHGDSAHEKLVAVEAARGAERAEKHTP